MKVLLILLTVLAVVWLLRSARRAPPPVNRAETPRPSPGHAVQTLKRCAHCGMHLAAGEGAVESRDGALYCSVAHRLAGPRAPFGPP
jgi:uncharacterized protein